MYFYFLLFFSFYLISGEELYHGCTDIKPLLLLLLLLLLLCGPPCPYLLANMDPFIPPPPLPHKTYFVSFLLRDCKGNQIMFLKYFQIIQVIPR